MGAEILMGCEEFTFLSFPVQEAFHPKVYEQSHENGSTGSSDPIPVRESHDTEDA